MDNLFSNLLRNLFPDLGPNFWISCKPATRPSGRYFNDPDSYALALLFEKGYGGHVSFKKIDASSYEKALINWFENQKTYHETIDIVTILRHGNTAADEPEIYRLQRDLCNTYLQRQIKVYLTYSHAIGNHWYDRLGSLIEQLKKADEDEAKKALDLFLQEACRTLAPTLAEAVNRASHNPGIDSLFEAAKKLGDVIAFSSDPLAKTFAEWRDAWPAASRLDGDVAKLLQLATQLTNGIQTDPVSEKKKRALAVVNLVRDLDHQVASGLRGVSGASDLFALGLSDEAIDAIRSSLAAILAKNYTQLAVSLRARMPPEFSLDRWPSVAFEIATQARLIRNSDRFVRLSLRQLSAQPRIAEAACVRAKALLVESRQVARRIQERILEMAG